MTLQQQIETAMREAMKARAAARVSTLRLAMAAAHYRQIELRRELTDDEVIEVLDRQVKQRQESIELFRRGGREDRARAEEAEIVILRGFMPARLSDGDLERLARDAIAASGATSPADMGRVMGTLVPQTRGRADGRTVSELVRRLLAG